MRFLLVFLMFLINVSFSMEQTGLRRRNRSLHQMKNKIVASKQEVKKCLKQHARVMQGVGTYFLVAGSFCLGAYCTELDYIKNEEINRQICYHPEIKKQLLHDAKVASFMTITGLLCCIQGSTDRCC